MRRSRVRVSSPPVNPPQGAIEVARQQTMKLALTGFAADGEAAGVVGAGVQTVLDGLADRDVLVLNAVGHGDALDEPGFLQVTT